MEADVVVVGLGPGGENVANKLASAGLEVVGIDQHLVGGECPFYGCTPSKLMINATDRIGDVHRADGVAGVATVEPDFVPARTRIREEATHHWTDDAHVKRLEGVGVTIVRGHARLTGPGTGWARSRIAGRTLYPVTLSSGKQINCTPSRLANLTH